MPESCFGAEFGELEFHDIVVQKASVLHVMISAEVLYSLLSYAYLTLNLNKLNLEFCPQMIEQDDASFGGVIFSAPSFFRFEIDRVIRLWMSLWAVSKIGKSMLTCFFVFSDKTLNAALPKSRLLAENPA